MSVTLLDFQAQAAAQLSEAADEWVNAYAHNGVQYIGRTPIPFLGHLKAVTGAGKTPILTKVVGDLQNAVVLDVCLLCSRRPDISQPSRSVPLTSSVQRSDPA